MYTNSKELEIIQKLMRRRLREPFVNKLVCHTLTTNLMEQPTVFQPPVALAVEWSRKTSCTIIQIVLLEYDAISYTICTVHHRVDKQILLYRLGTILR